MQEATVCLKIDIPSGDRKLFNLKRWHDQRRRAVLIIPLEWWFYAGNIGRERLRRLKPYCAPLPRNGCCDKSPYPLSGRRETATGDLLAQYVCGSACGESVSGLFRERW